MDYKQKYLKYKQKYLNLLKDQKGGQPFLTDIIAGLVFSYLFEKNQRQLQLILTGRSPVMVQPFGNFTLNHKYRLILLGRSGLSILLATKLVQSDRRNIRLELQLAKRIMGRTHKLPEISPLTLVATLDERNPDWHNYMVSSVAFHPSLPLLVTVSADRTAKLWRLDNPDGSVVTCVATLEDDSCVISVAFHPSLPLLATGSNNTKLWRLDNPTGSAATCMAILENLIEYNRVMFVAFHPSLPLLATGSRDHSLQLWRLDKSDGSEVTFLATLREHSNEVSSVAFHTSLPLMVTGSLDHTVKLWRLDPNSLVATCVATLNEENGGHSDQVMSVAFHPSLPLLATGSEDCTMKLWRLDPDGSSATCVATLNEGNGGHINRVSSVAFHQTLPLLATGSWDTTTKLWRLDKPDGSVVTCVATLNDRSVYSVAFHPTLPLLATCSDDSLNLWNLLDRSGRVQIAQVSNTPYRWTTRYYA